MTHYRRQHADGPVEETDDLDGSWAIVPPLRGTEAEIRQIYPNAVWMPWDQAPAGTRVTNTWGDVGTVLCRFGFGEGVAGCGCQYCERMQCIRPAADHAALADWWLVRMDRWPDRPALEYPPALVPIEGHS